MYIAFNFQIENTPDSYVEIIKARAERDKLSHELYVMKQKTEQTENIKICKNNGNKQE